MKLTPPPQRRYRSRRARTRSLLTAAMAASQVRLISMTFHNLAGLLRRRIDPTAVGVVVAVSVIVCTTLLTAPEGGTAAAASSHSSTPSLMGVRDPASFTATPGISDPKCNGGRGVQFAAPWLVDGAPSIATATLDNGSTVVAISSGFPPRPLVIVHAFDTDCTPDPSFGRDGVETIAFPTFPHSEPHAITAINAISPARGGGFILVGQTWDGWLVGRLEQNGRLDPRFGHDGWSVLPWRGQATAVLQVPSGQIIVAGEEGGGCCVKAWVSALTSRGALDSHFGVHGRVQIPSGEDSGVGPL